MTKEAAYRIRRWQNATAETLDDAYKSCSLAKRRAYRYCIELCKELNGERFRIVGHNSMKFSVAFQFVNPDTGVLQLMYITKDKEVAYDL